MAKILFNFNDKQHLVEVGPSGSVTSDAEILWDERLHGPIRNDAEVGRMEAYDELEDILDIQGNVLYIPEVDENDQPILDEQGNVVYTDQPQQRLVRKLRKKQSVLPAHQAVIDAENQAKTNRDARAYLASTDWYVIRKEETGVAIPQEILDARAAARASIIE